MTVYSHLQVYDIINDHDKNCPYYQHIVDNCPTVRKRRYLNIHAFEDFIDMVWDV